MMDIIYGISKAGIKPSGDYDILVVKFPQSVYSLMLTQNSLSAAPVIYDKRIKSKRKSISGFVVNSGNANAATGDEGLKNAEKMAEFTAEKLGLEKESVLVFSTGVIGVQLPMDKVLEGITTAVENMKPLDLENSARAIMTTDSFPKYYQTSGSIDGKYFKIKGISKGAGMIHPNMATMLAFVFTDVKIDKELLDKIADETVNRTFNSIDVDGCESTNDSFLVVATGEGEVSIDEKNADLFKDKLEEVLRELGKMIVRDGEGATKLIEISVLNALNDEEAKKIAEAVATSNLFKTAMFGNDPNWGRVLSAVGQLHIPIDFSKVKLFIGDNLIYNGKPVDEGRENSVDYLKSNQEVRIVLDMGRGSGSWKYYTCDLTYKYVEINAEYTT
ncbi:bifunctional glutamate N-acetyltransferase/amino-acid acetyltransferase ArgJ [Persephonella sp.]